MGAAAGDGWRWWITEVKEGDGEKKGKGKRCDEQEEG